MKLHLSVAILALQLTFAASIAFGQPAGILDATIGTGGIVEPNVGSGNTFSYTDAALAPGREIIVSGEVIAGGVAYTAGIIRYLPTSVQDPSFGTNGVVVLPPPANYFLGTSATLAVEVQPNGEILTLFFAFNNTSTEIETLLPV